MNTETTGPVAQALMPQRPDQLGQIDRMLDVMTKSKFSMDEIERMLAVRERLQKEEARKAWVAAMSAFKLEPITIEKRRLVDFSARGGRVKYNYAELADYTEAMGPAMAKHGLSYRWESRVEKGMVDDAEGNSVPGEIVFVKCIVSHVDGHFEVTELHGPLDNSGQKNPIQQMGSTISFLQRYTLMQIGGVAARGMDDDGRGGADGSGDPDPQQELIDDLFDKIDLVQSRAELEKLLPSINALKNAAKRRSVVNAYRARYQGFTQPPREND